MKLLHIGDAHLGKRQYRSDVRYEDFFDTFREAVELAVDHGVDAVIQTGDLFDSSNPSIDTISRCIDIVHILDQNDIDFYAIVGNHERKRKEQWLDVIDRLGNANRLTTDPTVIESNNGMSVALYGIDAVRKPQWNTTDFSLTSPEEGVDVELVCMHELLAPPIYGDAATSIQTHDSNEVLDRFGRPVDVLALGDFHVPVEDTVNSTYVYYAGATEKTSRDQSKGAVVSLLSIDPNGSVNRSVLSLDTARPFTSCTITFEQGDGLEHVEQHLSEHDFDPRGKKSSVGVVELDGIDTGVTVSDVESKVYDHGAKVAHVIDKRESEAKRLTESLATDLEDPTGSIETKIDTVLTEQDLDSTVQDIESIVRDDETPKTRVRDQVGEVLSAGAEENKGDEE